LWKREGEKPRWGPAGKDGWRAGTREGEQRVKRRRGEGRGAVGGPNGEVDAVVRRSRGGKEGGQERETDGAARRMSRLEWGLRHRDMNQTVLRSNMLGEKRKDVCERRGKGSGKKKLGG